MNPQFIVDENLPFQVVKALRAASYEVVTVNEVAHLGMKNNELAELSIRLRTIIMTRDADFTHLSSSLMNRVRVIYVMLSGDPNSIARKVLENIRQCMDILRRHNIAMLNDEGCRPI